MLELLDTLKERNSHKGNGHFRIYGTLTIGHALHPGVQRVQSWPFKDMHYHGSNRQDFVFIRPPGIEEGGFTLRPDNVWYCKVLLLFSIQAQTDQNGSTEEFQCAFVSVLEPLAERSPDALRSCTSVVHWSCTSSIRRFPLSTSFPYNPYWANFPWFLWETLGPFLSSLLHAHGLSVRLLLKNSTRGLTVTLQRVLAMAAVSGILIPLPWDGPVMIEVDDWSNTSIFE